MNHRLPATQRVLIYLEVARKLRGRRESAVRRAALELAWDARQELRAQ